VKFYDGEDDAPEIEPSSEAPPPEDQEAAAAIEPNKRPKGRTRGPYGTRLSPTDRKLFLDALRAGCSFAAAAMSIGRSRDTVERWRMLGRAAMEGQKAGKGYGLLYHDMEKARGHSLRRLHVITQVKAKDDGRLALALLDRHDPDFRELREMRRAALSAEVVTGAAASSTEGAAGAQVAAKVTYTLTWDDGSPIGFPGLFPNAAPAIAALVAPGGNGGNGDGKRERPDDGEDDDLDG
jgi:hypothetical protein